MKCRSVRDSECTPISTVCILLDDHRVITITLCIRWSRAIVENRSGCRKGIPSISRFRIFTVPSTGTVFQISPIFATHHPNGGYSRGDLLNKPIIPRHALLRILEVIQFIGTDSRVVECNNNRHRSRNTKSHRDRHRNSVFPLRECSRSQTLW